MGEFPSGQREQTVNLSSLTSVVRIHSLPPSKLLITSIGSLHLQGLVQNQIYDLISMLKKNLILRLYSVMNKKSQAEYATITYGLTIERI